MIRLALRNPHLVAVLALALLVLGVVSYHLIPADLLPIFKTPAVQIVTFYPGMPPEVMERDIMSRLERWTGQSVGIEHQEAKAMLGVSVVKDFFREGISLDTAMSQVTSYAVSDMFYLPPGTIPPMVMPFDPTASLPLCLVSVSSPTMSEKKLYDVAYFELRNRLQSIQGVIAPAVYGGVLRRILAYVDPDKLASRGLAPMDVVAALKRQNVFIPAGNLKAGDLDYQVFANAMPEKVSDLDDIPVAMVKGRPVLLRDVARAVDSHQIQTNIVRVNGRRQVYIPIYRQPGANTIQIVDAIRAQLDRIGQRLREMDTASKDLVLGVVLDQSVYVRSAIRGLQVAVLLGALLAGLVVILFLRSFLSTLAIVMAIPLSLLAAFAGLYFTGDTINAMTLGGLALAVGILVDQSIVVLENILRHMRRGEGSWEAAQKGTAEVALPILVSTITFVVVFYPILFLSGMARFLFKPLAVAASLAIMASYLIAIMGVPVFCALFLTNPGRDASGTATGEASAGGLAEEEAGGWRDRFSSLLEAAIRWRWAVLATALGVFILAIFLLGRSGSELFPRVDAGQFQITMRLPSGTRIERTEQAIARVEEAITQVTGEADPAYPRRENHPDSNLRMLISNIGVLMDWPAAYTPNTGPMDAFLLVQLKGKRGLPGTFETIRRLRKKLPQVLPQAEFAFDGGGMLTAALNLGEPAPIHIQVSGSNLATAHAIGQIIAREMKKVPDTRDVRMVQRFDYPVVDISIDRQKAAYAGLQMDDVMQNLVTATNSSINFNPAFWLDPHNGNHYFVGAQYAENRLDSLETLRNVPLRGDAGSKPVPLRSVAKITRRTGPAVIQHRNITRVIDVYADTAQGKDTGSVVAEIEARLAASSGLAPVLRQSARGAYFEVQGPAYAGKGYSYELRGEVHQMRDAFKQFRGGLGIAVILVYLVMVAHFRSFLDPLVILLAVPLGFIGVAVALYGTGTPLSVQAFMGIIMMVGIVVEYSIVLIDFANQSVRKGMNRTSAIVQAARVRLRPILMTSLTTVLALLPMAMGLAGGQANIPLARTIVGGVLGAMVLSLLVVPCLYVAFRPSRMPAAAAVTLLLLAGLSGSAWAAPQPAAAQGADAVPVVLVAPATASAGARSLHLPGSLEAYERTDLFAKVTGYLQEMKTELGDGVQKGQLLARLLVPEMEARLGEAVAEIKAASAGVHKAGADARLAEEEAARLEAIQKETQGAVTGQEVDAAVAGQEAAHAAVDVAEAQLGMARARLEHLKVMMSYAVLRAPFAGRITRRYLDSGALVREGTSSAARPVFQVARDDKLRLVVQVPESAVPQVHTGTALEVRLDALPERLVQGTITRLAGVLDPETRSMRAEMDLDNDHGQLRAGMYARVKIALPQSGGLGVPSRALHPGAQGTTVLVARQGLIRQVPVTILSDDGRQARVTGELQAGEQVVVASNQPVEDGQKIIAKPWSGQ